MDFLRRPRKNGRGGALENNLKTPIWQHRGRLGRRDHIFE
jgi:hypothetical protein